MKENVNVLWQNAQSTSSFEVEEMPDDEGFVLINKDLIDDKIVVERLYMPILEALEFQKYLNAYFDKHPQ
jgi:hypothetical protein